jgi:hypothetical protein
MFLNLLINPVWQLLQTEESISIDVSTANSHEQGIALTDHEDEVFKTYLLQDASTRWMHED